MSDDQDRTEPVPYAGPADADADAVTEAIAFVPSADDTVAFDVSALLDDDDPDEVLLDPTDFTEPTMSDAPTIEPVPEPATLLAPAVSLESVEGDLIELDLAEGVPAESDLSARAERTPWQRVGDGLRQPKLTGAGVLIALLVGLLGFALIAQVKSNNSTSTLSSDRPDDLVRILSDLDSRKDRLTNEISTLQSTQAQLNSGAESKQAALNAAAQRADELGILAGTLPAQGTGLVVQLVPTKSPIDSIDVLQTVEELRGAGAEAMEISGSSGAPIRIIASTYFVDGDHGLNVSGTTVAGTLTITAIGDAQTMQTALTIPGGVDDSVERDGGTVLVTPATVAHVGALAPATSLKYAHPTS